MKTSILPASILASVSGGPPTTGGTTERRFFNSLCKSPSFCSRRCKAVNEKQNQLNKPTNIGGNNFLGEIVMVL